MSVGRHKVGLVVDRRFGNRLLDLERSIHLWVVESPANSVIVQQIWSTEESSRKDDLSSGVTSFQASDSESPEETCLRIASDLDEHHGEFGHNPPWSEIEVFGTELTPSLRQAFGELGATVFDRTRNGFRCRRSHE
jgi:hypothetical protein